MKLLTLRVQLIPKIALQTMLSQINHKCGDHTVASLHNTYTPKVACMAGCLRGWSYLTARGVEGGAWAETDWVVLQRRVVSSYVEPYELGDSTAVCRTK